MTKTQTYLTPLKTVVAVRHYCKITKKSPNKKQQQHVRHRILNRLIRLV